MKTTSPAALHCHIDHRPPPPLSKPSISIVIPSYNRREGVLALLAGIYRQQGINFEVIVVDDCSPDGSADAIAQDYPQVELLRNSKNGGPCVTRNRGILAAKADIVVGFDSDVTVVDVDLLQKTRAAFEKFPNAAGFAFRIYEPDGSSDDIARWWHAPSVATFSTTFFETDYFSGTAYAFRREAVICAGLFPEILYMHYEEVGLAFRIIDQGGRIYYHPELAAVHHAHPVARRNRIRSFYKPRNQVLITLLYYPFLKGCCYLLPRMVWGLLVSVKENTFRSFVEALNSIALVFRSALALRSPLRRETWLRIRRMRAALPITLAGEPNPRS